MIIPTKKPSELTSKATEGTKFTPYVKQYRFDQVSGELVELPDPLDVDKLVESCRQSALDKMFERFMPVNVSEEEAATLDDTERDLSDIGAALDTLEEYRSVFGLSSEVPLAEVLAKVEDYRHKQIELAEARKKIALDEEAQVAKAQKIADLKKQLEELQKVEGGENNA